MAKVKSKNDELFFGLSGAASFLGCDYRTVSKAAHSGRLPFTRDTSGKRLFRLADLQSYKRKYRPGNVCPRPVYDVDGRKAVAHG